jgi:thiol-disulfide isomerase/thioredoxin
MCHKPLAIAMSLASGAGMLLGQCEAPAPVREMLQNSEFRRTMGETQAQREARDAAFRKALAEYPDDYFVLRRKLLSFEDSGEGLAWARDERRQHPDSTVYEMIGAEALLGRNTPGAIKQMEAFKAVHPEMPRVYLQLADAFGFGKFRDKARVQAELDGYRKLCPNSTDSTFLNEMTRNGSPAQIAALAEAMRTRMEAAGGVPDHNQWETLWSLEFKAHPPAEHAALRKKIAEDLTRFEALNATDTAPKGREVSWLTFLRGGYQSIGDQARVDKINDEIVAKYARSTEAVHIEEQRFNKEHPFAPRGEEETEWRRLHLAAVREWLAKAPDNTSLLLDVFEDLAELPDSKAEEVTDAIDRFQAVYQKKHDFTTMPPFEWRIAGAYIKYKIRLDQVPALVEDSYRAMMDRQKSMADDDRNENSHDDATDYFQVKKARLLVDCYAVTKDAAKAREAVAAVALKEPEKQKSGFLTLKAKAAEVEGRKADALMLYRAAWESVPAGAGQGGSDDLAAEISRVWKEMGGTQEGYRLLTEKRKAAEDTDARWEKPKHPLPSFNLTDLQGKTWSLARLEGKTVLINVWATWCGPCVAEHPEFQKLYDKLKDRPDVSVLSFNVDEDMGKVAPYLAEHKYTFPVIPAGDVVDAVAPQLAIPRNWLVDRSGKLAWEQIGYGYDGKWSEMMVGKLDEVANTATFDRK